MRHEGGQRPTHARAVSINAGQVGMWKRLLLAGFSGIGSEGRCSLRPSRDEIYDLLSAFSTLDACAHKFLGDPSGEFTFLRTREGDRFEFACRGDMSPATWHRLEI